MPSDFTYNTPDLAGIMLDANRIKAGWALNDRNKTLMDRDAQTQQLQGQLAPMVAEGDYAGAANTAGQAGNLEYVQAMKAQQSSQQAGAFEDAKQKLDLLMKANDYAGQAFMAIADETDPAQRLALVQQTVSQIAPMVDFVIPGGSKTILDNVGEPTPERLRMFARRGVKIQDQIKQQYDALGQQFNQGMDTRKQDALEQNQNFRQGFDERKQGFDEQSTGWNQAFDVRKQNAIEQNDFATQDIERQKAKNAALPDVMNLRKNFEGLPEVITYKKVLPIIQTMEDALGRDTKAADLNLIFGAAYINDPNSVVRESESAMVINAGSPAQRYMGIWNEIVGGGRLTRPQREALITETRSRTKAYETQFNRAQQHYEGIIQRGGLNSADIIPPNLQMPTQGTPPGAVQPQTGLMPPSASPSEPIIQQNRTTGKMRMSNDGGRTWQPFVPRPANPYGQPQPWAQ